MSHPPISGQPESSDPDCLRRLPALALVLATAAIGICLHAARAEDAAQAAVRKDVVYFEGPAEEAARHKLDVYLPEGKKGFPILMFIHGGAWKNGSKELYGPLAAVFVKRGVGVVVPNYRLSPGVRHPEHVRDVARAFAWVAKHAAELGGDPKRLYVSGHSAGGHLAALLALDPRYLKAEGLPVDTIRGVIGISGPYFLSPQSFPDVFGTDEAKHSDAFPLRHVADLPGASLPRFLLLAADKDYPGLPLSAQTLQSAIEKHGGRAERHEIPDRDHISIIRKIAEPDDPAARLIGDFIAP